MFPSIALSLFLAAGAGASAPALAQDPANRPVLVLSVDEVVQRALENNVDLAVEKFNPQASALSIGDAEAVYDPTVFSNWAFASRTTKSSNAFAGADKVDNKTFTYNFGASTLLKTGGSLRADFTNNRGATNSVFNTFNPSFNSAFQVTFNQPLLKNRKLDSARLNLRLTKRNREISDLQFRTIVVTTLASVRKLYYDLIYATENLEAQRKNLSLAQKFLNENQIKVNVGTLAPLDVVSAESEVAGREEGVVIAENALDEALDAIKRVIFPKNDPDSWKTLIVAKDRPTAEPVAADASAAISNALTKRIDYTIAKKNLETIENQLELAKQGLKPSLDLSAIYGTSGTGGTQITRSGLGGPIVSTVPGGYGDALKQITALDFPNWSVGVNYTYPFGNHTAKNAEARAQIAYDQYSTIVRRLELQIASDVRTASRAVETNFKRVATTRSARTLQARRLDAEEKKFAAGMSTNFLVTQAQRDLAVAEVAEIRAIADYNKSLVDFERVQESAIGGGSGIVTLR